MRTGLARGILALALAGVIAGAAFAGWRSWREDAMEEEEEREATRDNLWRARFVIEGEGAAVSVGADRAFDCRSDGVTTTGKCGPTLVAFKEGSPALVLGRPAPGYRLAAWRSTLRGEDGVERPRAGPMPDGKFYINGMGYTDTGVTETVTAVFVREGDAR